MMKQRIIIFLTIIFFLLSIIPLSNLISTPNQVTKKSLYNINLAATWAAKSLYPFGVSIDPHQVIIGKNDWLFLGDGHDNTLTMDRKPFISPDIERNNKINDAMQSWNSWFTSKGVKIFRIMIGPNKGTIYPEYLPEWAKPIVSNSMDNLITGTNNKLYIDLRSPLLTAKTQLPANTYLYYKTDTHWNFLGGALAFQAFSQQIEKEIPTLKWPDNTLYTLTKLAPRSGGDLANFLRLSKYLPDTEIQTPAQNLPITIKQYDFDSMQVIHQAGNNPIPRSDNPILIKTEGALNNKKVLWLRDSFGTQMSQLMANTFSEIVQIHWHEAMKSKKQRIIQLVEEWKPDYVFITVVERSARNIDFTNPVPPMLLAKDNEFHTIRKTTPISLNDIVKNNLKKEYKIHGKDPYIDFTLTDPITPSKASYLNINITCSDRTNEIPLQFFWLDDKHHYYDEEHSIKFTFNTQLDLLDLRFLPKWISANKIRRLRLDIDAQHSCSTFKLKNIELVNKLNS